MIKSNLQMIKKYNTSKRSMNVMMRLPPLMVVH